MLWMTLANSTKLQWSWRSLLNLKMFWLYKRNWRRRRKNKTRTKMQWALNEIILNSICTRINLPPPPKWPGGHVASRRRQTLNPIPTALQPNKTRQGRRDGPHFLIVRAATIPKLNGQCQRPCGVPPPVLARIHRGWSRFAQERYWGLEMQREGETEDASFLQWKLEVHPFVGLLHHVRCVETIKVLKNQKK